MSDTVDALPSGWAWVTLAHVAQVSAAKVEPSERADEAYVGLEHIESRTMRLAGHGYARDVKSTKSVFKRGDVLYGKLRPYLRKAWVAEFDGVCSTDILVFSKSSAIESRLLALLLTSESATEHAIAGSAGINLPRTSAKVLGEFGFALPPLEEQRRIVARLDELLASSRAARDALDAVPVLLEQFRQAVLAAAFRGELTADWRETHRPKAPVVSRTAISEDRRGSRSRVAEETAQLGAARLNLPAAWLITTLGTVAKLQPGYAFSSADFRRDGGIRLLRGVNIEPGATRWGDTVYLAPEQAAHFGDYVLHPGDVVIAMDRPFISTGLKVARLRADDLPALLLQRVGRFRVTDLVNPDFLWWYLHSVSFTQHAQRQATGTQVPHISANDIETAPFPLPSIEEQRAIVARIVEHLTFATETNRREEFANGQFDALEQGILAKAFRGDLVPQDPTDEPASSLLDRIRAERATTDKPARKATRRTSARA